MPKAIIFDLDGTLLDTLTDLMNAVNAALLQYGLPARSREEIRRFLGNGFAKLTERAIGCKDHPLYPQILRQGRANYAACCRENTAPYPGIPEMLRAFDAAGIRMGVVSNKPDAQVKVLCADFFPQLHAAIGQREGVPLKPAPEPLLAAMDALHCTAAETVYAGDSDVDILTAQNAGIPCISVLWGFRDRAVLEAAGGTVFAQSPVEMLQRFQSFFVY